MSEYGTISEKGDDDPDPAHMIPCGEFRLRSDNSSSDKLNGSIRLSEQPLDAVGIDPGERVQVYIEANNQWVQYERKTYSDRAGVGLPMKYREKLGLNQNNRSISIWIDEPEDQTEETSEQASLTNDTTGQEFVWIMDNESTTYHHVASNGGNRTICKTDFGEKDHKIVEDPGDVLEECEECSVRSSTDMTQKELINWLGNEIGFDTDSGTAEYLSKPQIIAIRDYVVEQEYQSPEQAEV